MPQLILSARHWSDPGTQWRTMGLQNSFSILIENQRYKQTLQCCPAKCTCTLEVPEKKDRVGRLAMFPPVPPDTQLGTYDR